MHMDKDKLDSLSSLFDIFCSIERKWANEWNNQNAVGLSKSHILILEMLAQEGPIRPSTIAERLKVTTGGVTVLTTKLSNAGFIEKTQNSADKRASQLEITKEGEEILQQSRTQVSCLATKMFGMLNHEEIETLNTIFKKCLVQD